MTDVGTLAAGLRQALARGGPSFLQMPFEVKALRRLSGGASQEIWAFDCVSPGISVPLILRRVPGERGGAYAAGPALEAQVMRQAARSGVLVPAICHELGPEDGIGCGFIMARIEGEALASRILREPQYAPARARFAEQASDMLWRIHRSPVDTLTDVRVATPHGELDGLHALMRRSVTRRPVFELAMRWLRDHVPDAGSKPQLVHGDFRNGNIMFGPEGIRAVLDWELCHLGDPLEDLGWLSVGSWRFGRLDLPFGGIAGRIEFLDAYAARSGRPVDQPALRFWETLGTLRWGLMCDNMVSWVRSGEDRSVERVTIARRASETEIDLLRLIQERG